MNSQKEIVIVLSYDAQFGYDWEETGLSQEELQVAEEMRVQCAVEFWFPNFEVSVVRGGVMTIAIEVEGVSDSEQREEVMTEVRNVIDSLPDFGELSVSEIRRLAGKGAMVEAELIELPSNPAWEAIANEGIAPTDAYTVAIIWQGEATEADGIDAANAILSTKRKRGIRSSSDSVTYVPEMGAWAMLDGWRDSDTVNQ